MVNILTAAMMRQLGGMRAFFGPFRCRGVSVYLQDVVTTMTSH